MMISPIEVHIPDTFTLLLLRFFGLTDSPLGCSENDAAGKLLCFCWLQKARQQQLLPGEWLASQKFCLYAEVGSAFLD